MHALTPNGFSIVLEQTFSPNIDSVTFFDKPSRTSLCAAARKRGDDPAFGEPWSSCVRGGWDRSTHSHNDFTVCRLPSILFPPVEHADSNKISGSYAYQGLAKNPFLAPLQINWLTLLLVLIRSK